MDYSTVKVQLVIAICELKIKRKCDILFLE